MTADTPKAKRKPAQPKITVKASEPVIVSESVVIPKPKTRKLRSIYESTLIIPEAKTLTGQKYHFEPGQVKPVHILDYHFLVSLELDAGGCCGSSAKPQKYFEEV